MSLFSKIKDKVTSALFKKYADRFIKDFGNLNDLKIDSANKDIYLSVNLKGENESVTINLSGYEVVKSKYDNFIQFNNITTSREWINVGLEKFYLERRIEIPAQYTGIIKFLL